MHKTTFIISALLSIVFCFGQTIREQGYSITYQDRATTIAFDDPTLSDLQITDAFTNKLLSYFKNGDTYKLANTSPGSILKMSYRTPGNENGSTAYLATPSASSGDIKVYFNHPVATQYSQIQQAVNLGNTVDNKLIALINACSGSLDIAIYNSYSPSSTAGIAGAINAAFARGVQVRVIYDGSTSSAMLPLLNVFIPTLSSPTDVNYGIMHNKFVIFDANHLDANKPLVWTGSTNWTTTQIDGPDQNNVITIQDQALALAYTIEFEEMWGSNTDVPNAVNARFGPDKANNTPHSFIIGGKTVESYFSPTDNTNSKIIASINTAQSDIDIATMLITRSDIANTILNKYNNGLTDIQLVTDSQNTTGNQFATLQAGLAPGHAVLGTLNGIMHHKFMVVDNFNSASDPLVVTGSHNWSSAAQTKNDENTLIVHDANVANQYFQAFAYIYENAGGVFDPLLASAQINSSSSLLTVVPNPTSGVFAIANRGEKLFGRATISITNSLGQNIFSKDSVIIDDENIDLSGHAPGVYFVSISQGNKVFRYKVLRE